MTVADAVGRIWKRGANLLTSEFNYRSEFFFGIDYLMAVGGLRYGPKKKQIVPGWWKCYRLLMPLIAVLMTCKLVVNLIEEKGLDRILNNVQMVIGTVAILVRGALIVRYWESLERVREYINRRDFGKDQESSLRVRAGAFYKVRRLVMILALAQFWGTVLVAMQDMTEHDTFGLPFDVRGVSVFLQTLLQKLYSLSLLGLTYTSLVGNMVVYMVLKGLLTELTIVAQCFEGIMQRTVDQVAVKMDGIAGNSKYLHHLERTSFWESLHREFRTCIELHQNLLDVLTDAKPFLNATLLTLFYSTMLNIACGIVYLLSTEPSKFGLYSAQMFYYIGTLFFECYVLSYLVTKLTNENESIGFKVYCLPWPTELQFEAAFARWYRATVTSIRMVLAKSQQKLGLNCFGFFEFTLEQFAELVNQTYSLVTFFRNFV